MCWWYLDCGCVGGLLTCIGIVGIVVDGDCVCVGVGFVLKMIDCRCRCCLSLL